MLSSSKLVRVARRVVGRSAMPFSDSSKVVREPRDRMLAGTADKEHPERLRCLSEVQAVRHSSDCAAREHPACNDVSKRFYPKKQEYTSNATYADRFSAWESRHVNSRTVLRVAA